MPFRPRKMTENEFLQYVSVKHITLEWWDTSELSYILLKILYFGKIYDIIYIQEQSESHERSKSVCI